MAIQDLMVYWCYALMVVVGLFTIFVIVKCCKEILTVRNRPKT